MASHSRNFRRHQASRILQKVRRKAKAWYDYGYITTGEPIDAPHRLRILVNHRPRCSCWMCGNPRRHFGEVTRQEKLAPEPEFHCGMSVEEALDVNE